MGARDAFTATIARALKPDQRVSIAEWAEKYRVLPPDSPEPGKWRNERTPYLVGIMDALCGAVSDVTRYAHDDDRPFDNRRVRFIDFMKGHQIGGSAAGENFIGHAITTAAGNILAVFPTNELAEKWETNRFEPMRTTTPELRRRVRDPNRKGASNTKRRKKFPGGMLLLVNALKPSGLKSTTVRYVLLEEVDEFALNIKDQGNPIDLAVNRTSNFGSRAKIFANSTPTLDGSSQIQMGYEAGDQRRYFVHCPCCGHPQFFEWKNMRWPAGDYDQVAYFCNTCGVGSAEHEWKTVGYEKAYWMPTAQGSDERRASFHLSSLYAPIGWRPWPELARDWDAAQSDTEKLIKFTNNELGLPYKETSGTEVKADVLQARAESYAPMTCPMGGLIAVAGVDTQDNRLAVTIRAYGREEESWGLFWDEIYGSPSDQATWKKLEEILLLPIRHESGQLMRVEAAAIDTGGHHAHDVYAFCKTANMRGRHWFAIKGAKPVDAPVLGKPKTQQFNYQGQPVPGGCQLRQVGTQVIKTRIDYRLREVARAGPGFMHMPMSYPAEYYQQMRSEKQIWRKDTSGRRARVWNHDGKVRNEAWDCEVYCYSAFHYITASNPDVQFRLREKVFGQTTQADLFARPAPAPDTEAEATAAQAVDDVAPDAPASPIDAVPADMPDRSPLSPLNPFGRQRRRGMRSRGFNG